MKQHVMKVYGTVKVGYIACVFNFGPGWRWVISLTVRPICFWRNGPWFSWWGCWEVPTASMFPVENRKFSYMSGIISRFAGWHFRFSYNNFTCVSNLFALITMAVSKHTLHSVSNHHSCLVFVRTVSFSVHNILLNFFTFNAKSKDQGDIHHFLFLFFFP